MPRGINNYSQFRLERRNSYSILAANQLIPNGIDRSITMAGNVIAYQPNDIITNGLVCYLDAGLGASYPQAGTTCFDLGGNNNGTLINGVSYSNSNSGIFQFTRASNQYISTNFTSGNIYTFSAWFNPSAFNGVAGDYYAIFILNLSNYVLCALTGIGTLTFWTTDGLSPNTLGTSTFAINNWYNVTFVREGQSVTNGYKAYINGALTGSANTSTAWTTSGTLWIGSRSDIATQGFQGSQGLFMAYNRALTAGEVLQNYNAQRTRFGK